MSFTKYDYTVGWIAALPVELAAARGMMEKPIHPMLPSAPGDTNRYTLGRIGHHNVVLVCLPTTGTNAAAHTAANLKRSFPKIRFSVMVGIGGGVPSSANADATKDVRLGDVVVSTPDRQHGGVIQYDFGTLLEGDGKEFIRKGHLNKPPSILINVVRDLQADTVAGKVEFIHHYHNMLEDHPEMASKFGRPEIDKLFRNDYYHQQGANDCRNCLDEGLVPRKPRLESVVHYGLIGSANRVLRSAMERDVLNNTEGVICFEMEAAGLMDEFSCIVIRGICDYCDSHKSKVWQPYASVMAAAFAKTLLLKVPSLGLEDEELPQQFGSISRQLTSNVNNAAANSIDSIRHRECLQALGCTHPRIDKRRLEDIKGGLLRDAYKWILNTDEYNIWSTKKESMWIKGDAGKGKTMLLCGIIDETTGPIAYFFCQATLDTNNSAIQVLRGLILSILDARRDAPEVIFNKIQQAQDLPTGSAFYALGDVLEDLLAEGETILMVDALDECVSDLDKLLRLIVKTSTSDNCKWVVTSRNIPEIEEHLGALMRLSLELNDESVSASVDFYIRYKVQQLSSVKKYGRVDLDLEEYILQYLLNNAQGTFLWVSLVCQRLSKVKPYQAKTVVRESPRGLTELYQQMLKTIQNSDENQVMKEILAIVSTVYRPVTLEELCTLLDFYKNPEFDQVAVLQDLVEACGCFLTVKESVVNLVHLSAKDFLTGPASAHIHEYAEVTTHRSIVRRSVRSLVNLKKNMYDLKDPGIRLEDIAVPDPDPHARVSYAITYWADHLLHIWSTWREAELDMSDVALADTVLSSYYLYWLESLCLLQQIHPVMNTMLKLADQLDTMSQESKQHVAMTTLTSASDRFRDALQFYRYFQAAIEDFPMQVYISGLLFCPMDSYIKKAFSHEIPTWATVKSGSRQTWPQNLSLDSQYVYKLVWSSDDEEILTWDDDDLISLWQASSGALLMSTCREIVDLQFSEVVGSIVTLDYSMENIEILSASTGQFSDVQQLQASAQRLSRFDDRSQETSKLARTSKILGVLSSCGKFVARAWRDNRNHRTITEINVCETGQLLQVWSDVSWPLGLCFATNQLYLAGTGDGWVRIWNVQSGEIVWNADWDVVRRTNTNQNIMFSPCCKFIAVQQSARVQIWDWSNKGSQHHSIIPSTELRVFRSFAFDADSAHMFIGDDKSVRRYTLEGQQMGSWEAFSHEAQAIVVSESGTKIAIICYNDTKVCKVKDMVFQPVSTADTSHDVEFTRVCLCKNWVYGTIDSDEQHMTWSCRDSSAIDGTLDFDVVASSDILVLNQDRSMVASQSPLRDNIIVRDLVSSTNTEHCLLKTDGNSTVVAFGPGKNELTLLNLISSSFWSCSSHGVESDRWRVPPGQTSSSFSLASWASDGLSFLVGFWDSLHIWHVNTRDWKLVKNTGSDYTRISFSSEGSMFAVCKSTTGLELFRTNTLERIFAIPEHGESSSLVFDGIWLKTDTIWCKPAEGSFSPDTPLIIHPSNRLNIEFLGRWIRSGSQNLIWLPKEIRGWPRDSRASLMIIGLAQFRVLVLEIQWNDRQQI